MSFTFVNDIAPRAKTRRSAPRSTSGMYRNRGKRFFDIVVVLLIAPFVFPVLLAVWLLTALSGGKALYSQFRVGKGGNRFRCLKIRTMVPNAEKELETLMANDPAIASEWETHQKLENDPRITPLGHFLRRSSLDELPQLLNVLVGDMSLIGPRPFTPEQKALYDAEGIDAYYSMRPGISGPWQVSCRHESTFQERVAYDEDYANDLSFMTDAKIALRTIGVVLKASGR